MTTEPRQRAVFLDRDGTLIVDRKGLLRAEELELLPGVAEAVAQLNQRGWRTIVVTNQPVIANGLCSEADLGRIHDELRNLLGRKGAFLDRIYFRPHHPEKGVVGERPELKLDCDCRKPKPGMIMRAAQELNLDLSACWMIGDATADLQTARNAGVRSILVRTGHAGRDGKFAAAPNFTAENLLEAVARILGG